MKQKNILVLIIAIIMVGVLLFSNFGRIMTSPPAPEETISYITSYQSMSDYEKTILSSIVTEQPIVSVDILEMALLVQQNPDENYGSYYQYVEAGTNSRQYFKIDAGNLFNFVKNNNYIFSEFVNSASFWLYVVYGTPRIESDYYYHATTENQWDEDTITWSNRPPETGKVFIHPDGVETSYTWKVGDSYLGWRKLPLYGDFTKKYWGGTQTHFISFLENWYNDWNSGSKSSVFTVAFYGSTGSNGQMISHKHSSNNYHPYIELDMDWNVAPWALPGGLIEKGFSKYEVIDNGYKIKNTTARITTYVPPLVYENVGFDIEASTGQYQDALLTAKLYQGGVLKGTYTGTYPKVSIEDYHNLKQGSANIIITASRDGKVLTANRMTTVGGIELVVTQPPYYVEGQSFNLGVTFTDTTISRPVTVKFYQNNQEIDSYSGTMPEVTISNPQMSGSVKMVVSSNYMNQDYTKEFWISFDAIQLVVVQPGTYQYGISSTIQVYINVDQTASNPITASIKDKYDNLLEYYQGTTPSITLVEPKAIGNVKLIIQTSYLGVNYERTLDVFFGGYPIQTSVYADANYWSEFETIVFYVEVKDINGVYMTPIHLSNILPVCTLSQGNIESSTADHLGNGKYKVTTEVTGTGNFIGKITFDYLNTPFESAAINMYVDVYAIGISTINIPTQATRNKAFTGEVQIFDTLNNRIDPDNIEIIVHYPDGATNDIISFNQLTKKSIGVYQFSYYPTQLEKYTFEVTAHKTGMVSGTGYADVIVGSEYDPGEDDDFDLMAFFFQYIWVFIILFIAVIFILWKYLL
jgi:hypothetical protein